MPCRFRCSHIFRLPYRRSTAAAALLVPAVGPDRQPRSGPRTAPPRRRARTSSAQYVRGNLDGIPSAPARSARPRTIPVNDERADWRPGSCSAEEPRPARNSIVVRPRCWPAPGNADLLCGLRAHPGSPALIDRGLADPLPQRLRGHPQPPGHHGDRRVLRRVITGVLAHKTDRPGLGVLVVPNWH